MEDEEKKQPEAEEAESGYLLPDKAYDVLKWVGLFACPALAVFMQAIGPAWGMPFVNETVLTLNSLGVLIGALIGVSAVKGTKDEE